MSKLLKSYRGKTLSIGGPGGSDAPWSELGGIRQDRGTQRQRLAQARAAIAKAWKEGDRDIHIIGHSRGAGNAVLLAQQLKKFGIIDPVTKKRLVKPGVRINSLTLLDAVPHAGSNNQAVALGKDGLEKIVSYRKLRVPPNVKNYTHVLAGGENRVEFRPALVHSNRNTTLSRFISIPNATHKDVGGNPKGNPDAIDVSHDVALRRLSKVSNKFNLDNAKIKSAQGYREVLARLHQTQPQQGLVEKLVGLAFGAQKRTFPKYVVPASTKNILGSQGTASAPGSKSSH